MSTATEIFEIIFYDPQEQRRRSERLGIREHAIRLARRLVLSGYESVDVRDVYRNEYLEDVAWAKAVVNDLVNQKGETRC